MAQRTVDTNQPQANEMPVDVRDGDKFVPKHFQVTSVSLRRPKQGSAGILIVFHDVTQIRSLEAVRKDFVANVSHQLPTPLSIFTRYLETPLQARPNTPTPPPFFFITPTHPQPPNL